MTSSGLRAGIGFFTPPRRLVNRVPGRIQLQMGATRGGGRSQRPGYRHLPAPRFPSGRQSSAISVENDYGRPTRIRLNAKSHFCPKYQSEASHRSKRRGAFELTLLFLLPVRSFRCRDCDCRFYGLLFSMHSNRSKIPMAGRPNA
jgi:hypothetical protein